MSHPSVGALIADLADAFPRTKVGTATFRVYIDHLQDLPVRVLADTMRELVNSEEFFPSVAQIRRRAAERMLALPTETEALAQIDARMQWSQSDQRDVHPPAVHECVTEALKSVGGFYAIRTSERPEVVRGQFSKRYAAIRLERVQGIQFGNARALPAA